MRRCLLALDPLASFEEFPPRRGTTLGIDGVIKQLENPASFGEGLTLVDGKEVSNAAGWKGYQATFSCRPSSAARSTRSTR